MRLLTTILCILSLFIFAVAIIDWQYSASLVGVEKMGMEYVDLEGQRAYAYEVRARSYLFVMIVGPRNMAWLADDDVQARADGIHCKRHDGLLLRDVR